MASRKDLVLGIKGDTAKLKTGLDAVASSLNEVAKNVKQVPFNRAAIASTALVNSVSALTGAVKTFYGITKELSESYKTQIEAETKLQQAAKNNPYLDSSSVKHLQDYASQLQSISTYGDEQLLPVMANLAAQGKTESQIMDIMSASLDLAAGSGMSLESAVSALNATLNGNAGTLGKQNTAIKALTAEQLKNSEAIKIIKEQYAGMAEETAKATGTSQQFKNAWGDLKEELGATFEEGAKPMRRFFTEFFANWAAYKKARRLDKTDSDIDVETAKLEELRQAYENVKDDVLLNERTKEKARKKYEEQKKVVEDLTKSLEEEKAAHEALIRLQEQEAAAQKKTDTAQAALNTYNKTIEKKLKEIELNRQAAELQGQQFDEQKAMQEELEVRAKAYVQLLEDAQGTISGNAEREVKEREKILELVKKTAQAQGGELNEAQKKEYNRLIEEINALNDGQEKKQSELMQEYLNNLDTQYKEILKNESIQADEKLKIEEQYTKSRQKLLDLQAQAVKDEQEQERQATLESAQKKIEIAGQFVSTYAQTMTTLSNMVTKAAQAEADARIAALEKELEQGTISQEEYAERKEEIEKESAEKQYKIQMWEWSASLLQIAVNTAEGITKVIAQTGIVGVALAGAIATLGAVQLSAAMLNRPVKPSFATGGIVGGTSYTGDKVQANVNSREMILNMRQQKAMFDAINNGSIGKKGNTEIKVYNSVSNLVKTKTQTAQDGAIELYITSLVKSGITSGAFNQALESANSKLGGVRYVN